MVSSQVAVERERSMSTKNYVNQSEFPMRGTVTAIVISVLVFLCACCVASAQIEGIIEVPDMPYVEKGVSHQKLDLYLPSRSSKPQLSPVVLWIHGGGFEGGDKTQWSPTALTRFGYAVASMNYRFSNEAIFPAQLEDCYEAVQFLRKNAPSYGLDCDRMAVFGASAGGQLAVLLASRLASEPGNKDLKAIVDWSAPTDLLTYAAQDRNAPAQRHGPSGFVAKWIGGLPEERPDLARLASPVFTVRASLPPVLIMHGTKDDIVPIAQSEELYAALTKVGVKTEFRRVRGGTHMFASEKNVEMVRRFLDARLANP
jgi:acetyl esterase/lipase